MKPAQKTTDEIAAEMRRSLSRTDLDEYARESIEGALARLLETA